MSRIGILLAGTLLPALGAGPLQAQATGTIAGRVLAETGSPLARAQVTIIGANQVAHADDSGAYVFANLPAGTYSLRVRYLGYGTVEADVTVQPGAVVRRDIQLSPLAITLKERVVTVGSRARHTAADELAVPVDVFPRLELQATAQPEMAAVLQEVAPSVNFPRPQIADITSGVRPFQIRGLSPDHSLVLVNGQRRHSTAVVHVFGAGSMNSGSSGVDMNAIPPAAVDAIEILRDGAAAQYGSDAIAGVVSLKLRDDVHDPEVTASWGQYFPGPFEPDGPRLELAGNWGIPLFGKGTLNVTAAYGHRNRTHRAGPDPRDQLVPGDHDSVAVNPDNGLTEVVEKRNPVPQPNHLIGDGIAINSLVFWNARYERLYAFGGYSVRRDIHSGFYRRALDRRNWPLVHPLGFLPKFRSDTRDIMAVAGLDGRLGAWTYDASAQWGKNRVDTDIFDSHNASLGPCLDAPCAPGADGVLGTADDPGIPNKTDMYAGSLDLNQLIAAVDLMRPVEIGTHGPLNVAVGLAFRADNYKVIAGEPASYINGFHRNQYDDDVAQGGAQVFTGYAPEQEANAWRNNVGAYVDLETAVTDRLLLAGAARFERYNDFGETLTGKVAARLQAARQLVFRAAASTGFRAPSLSQSYYTHVSTAFRTDTTTGDQVPYEVGEFPVNSPEARALGAVPLKEETSVNYSGGFAFTPIENLTLTVDGYRVAVKDRIILTGSMEGARVLELLSGLQAEAVKFFTNSVDTRTTGVDVTARYRYVFTPSRYLETLFAYNYNDLEVTGVHVPPVIEQLRDQVFDRGDELLLERGRARDRSSLKVRYTGGRFRIGAGLNYYGVQTNLLQENPDVFLNSGPHTVLDVETACELRGGVEIALGVENLTDRRPAVVPEGQNFFGIFPYLTSSSLSINGRYAYTRVRAPIPL